MGGHFVKKTFKPFPVLITERLILKELQTFHIDALYGYHSNAENFKFVQMNVHLSREETKAYIQKMNDGVKQNKWIIWAICLRETDEIIGTISIWNLNEERNSGELGYGIFPDFRRNGFMREALDAVVSHAFDNLSLELVEAYTGEDNIPSIQFLESTAFQYVETIIDDYSNGERMKIYRLSHVSLDKPLRDGSSALLF